MDQAHYGPGDVCPESGLWAATSGEKADIALSKGDRFPPLEVEGARWILKAATTDAADPELEPVEGPISADAWAALARTADSAGEVDAETYTLGAPVPAAVAGEPQGEPDDPATTASVAGSPALARATADVIDAARDLVTGQPRAGATGSDRWLRLRRAVQAYDAIEQDG